MLNLKYENWENCLELTPEKINIVAVENKHQLYLYLKELLKAADGELNDFMLFNEKYDQQTISKYCTIETNLAGLTLNSKKLITSLYKKCGTLAIEPEHEYKFRKNIKELFDICAEISLDIGYDVVLSENCEPSDIFKLFELEIKEEYKTLAEKLVAYVNANIELIKTKVFIFLFLTKFLNSEELKQFFYHCECQNVSLLLIEDDVPNQNYLKEINHKILIIDNDLCEIIKN